MNLSVIEPFRDNRYVTVEQQTIATTLKYKATSNRNGYRRIDLCLLQMGRLYNTVIDHRQSATGSHRRKWSSSSRTPPD